MAMKTNLQTLIGGLALSATMFISPSAIAHDWRGYGGGHGFAWNDDYRDQRGGFLARTTCSGERGDRTQSYLNREIWNGNLDRRAARRIQHDIDRLRYREAHECREGDYRSARWIGEEYSRLRNRIDAESGRFSGGWHRR
jgi:hypothetical protein